MQLFGGWSPENAIFSASFYRDNVDSDVVCLVASSDLKIMLRITISKLR